MWKDQKINFTSFLVNKYPILAKVHNTLKPDLSSQKNVSVPKKLKKRFFFYQNKKSF